MSSKQDAQKIAKHFISSTSKRATPAIMKKTVSQAKTLLQSGYTCDEVISVIDYLINKRKIEIYSLGYIIACINDILRNIRQEELEKEKEKNKAFVKAQEEEHSQLRSEVVQDKYSSERNKGKADRLGVQPRFGEELDFDMLEGK